MIISFACKETERIYDELRPKKRKLSPKLLQKALKKLQMLDAAESITDLYVPPSNHLEALSGKRDGHYSIRIDRRWRICFGFADGQANNVEIVDYH